MAVGYIYHIFSEKPNPCMYYEYDVVLVNVRVFYRVSGRPEGPFVRILSWKLYVWGWEMYDIVTCVSAPSSERRRCLGWRCSSACECASRRARSCTSRQVRLISNTYRRPRVVESLNIEAIVPWKR